MSSRDVVRVDLETLVDIDLYLKAVLTLLQTLDMDLSNSIKALRAAQESIQKSLGAIQVARKSD
ncbi:MAG: hypothetical protein HY912_10780 [Desulfomonile tiedjei]|uniref:Uncharacterized protein n=1 Tax=Desulfomonile tiedjei TaxID=2358 RepID=A0A9D6V6H7_9BACT|nr:hypothetical protein [Desulfomonile tiedjei]